MVKTIVLFIVMASSTCLADAQILREVRGYLRMKTKPIFQRRPPVLTTSPELTAPYWQGTSYTNFSENGRLRSTLMFDIHGQLRESSSSINLKKTGALSYWRIQFSPRRSQPVLVFTIH